MFKKSYSYSKQCLSFSDYFAVLKTLRSDFLTCGPKVTEFEKALSDYTGAKYCVAVSSGTAALHLATLAINIKQGDEIITSPNTFVATANSAIYCGARPSFVDIEEDTGNIDPLLIEKAYTNKTKAIIPVHFAGQSCDMEKISEFAKQHKLFVIEDAAHAIGSNYKGTKVGSCKFSDLTIFSFHPVKNITTGEGGAITTNNEIFYKRLLALRSHGIYKDGDLKNDWRYEMRELGYNYRLTDIQAALGISQLKKIEKFKQKKREIVEFYNSNLKCTHLKEHDYSDACFHLYPILIKNRDSFYHKAKEHGLSLQVHYIPVTTQPFYKDLGYDISKCPNALSFYNKVISIPLYQQLKKKDLFRIVSIINELAEV